MLVAHVRVVPCRGQLGGALLRPVEVVGAEVDAVEFDVVFDVGTDGLWRFLRKMANLQS